MKKLRVTVEGKAYEVLVEFLDEPASKIPAQAAPTAFTPAAVVAAPVANTVASSAPAQAGDVPSPLAGKVVSIDVQVGQAVAEGAQLATVEAMKMNTHIFAPRAGNVVAILTAPGAAVEEGTALLRLG
jgi:biotin carboxyl carrier protein